MPREFTDMEMESYKKAAVRLFNAAETPAQARDAYMLARAFGLPASYGEDGEAKDSSEVGKL